MLIDIQLLPVSQKWVTNYEVDFVLVNMHICPKNLVWTLTHQSEK